MPVPSPVNGIIDKRFVEDGATVKAGQDLCTITITGNNYYFIFNLICYFHKCNVFLKIYLEGGPAPTKSAPKVKDVPKAKEPEAPVAAAAAPATPPPQTSVPPPVQTSAPPPVQREATPPVPTQRVVTPPAAAPQISKQQAAIVKLPPADPTKEISGTRSEYRVKMNRMRLRIAQRLKDAQNVNAMLTTFNEIDMR